MIKFSPIAILVMIAIVSLSPDGSTAEKHGRHGGHKMTMKSTASPATSCELAVRVTDEAERQPGGALYRGASVMHHRKHKNPMPEMKGAHMDHRPRYGGAFFMAPDKIHHLEGVFSEKCGFRLVFFNAFTKHIRAQRFRAFIKVVPDKQHEPEIMRFLSPNGEGTVMHADIGNSVTKPFGIELYVKFPESDDPQLFNIRVSAPSN